MANAGWASFSPALSGFFASHRDQVSRRSQLLALINEAEHRIIVAHAKRLAIGSGCCESEIARRVGRKLHRSPATILHTLRKHDNEHHQQAVFRAGRAPRLSARTIRRESAGPITRGMSPKAIARKMRCRRSAVYRALMDERLEKLSRRKIRFIDDPLYHQDDAASAVEAIASQDDLMRISRPEDSRVPRDLPAYLQELYRTPLLSAAYGEQGGCSSNSTITNSSSSPLAGGPGRSSPANVISTRWKTA